MAASNANLEENIKEERFRQDLYFRLNVLRIEMPPLRARPEDIPSIVRALLNRLGARSEQNVPLQVSAEALGMLVGMDWPGNVRELANALERGFTKAVAEVHGKIPPNGLRIELAHLGRSEREDAGLSFRDAKAAAVREWTVATIKSALAGSNGNVTHAARALKMQRTAMLKLMKKYDVRR